MYVSRCPPSFPMKDQMTGAGTWSSQLINDLKPCPLASVINFFSLYWFSIQSFQQIVIVAADVYNLNPTFSGAINKNLLSSFVLIGNISLLAEIYISLLRFFFFFPLHHSIVVRINSLFILKILMVVRKMKSSTPWPLYLFYIKVDG